MALTNSVAQTFSPGLALQDGTALNNAFANLVNSVTAGQIATGTTQATAVPMPSQITQFATVAVNTGGLLQITKPGSSQDVYNDGASPLTVYPPVGSNCDAAGVNVGVPLANGKRCRYTVMSPGVIESAQLGAVSA